MRTLVTTDGSAEATLAMRSAGRLLRRTNNRMCVVCVAPQLKLPPQRNKRRSKQETIQEAYVTRINSETQLILERAQSVLAEEGHEATTISRIGSPASEIAKLAPDFDVITVGAGSQHRSRFGLGPVASRVAEHSPRTVLIARELTGESNLRVLVPVDGSLASHHALRTMMAYFDIDEAEITLLHVVETPWIRLGLDREWFDFPGSGVDRADPEIHLERELQVEAQAVIEDARSLLADRSYSVITAIEEGNPATQILGEAEQRGYDLIVIGTSGVTDFKHSALGSVSAKVAWEAQSSVALVKYVE